MSNYFSGLKSLFTIGMLMAIAVSCQKFNDPPLVFEEYGTDSSTEAERKVLVIVAEGVSGAELASLSLPNITALQNHGKYTYNLRQQDTSRASYLASIINGVNATKHVIRDSTFLPIDDHSTEEHADLINYPTMFSYLLQYKRNTQTAMVTSWRPYEQYLRIANYHVYTNNDAQVRDSSISLLRNHSAIGAMVVDFDGPLLAGESGGFTTANSEYRTALETLDANIGAVVNSLQSRPNYSKEDWLIMVTSAYGGEGAGSLPGFMIVSNSKLTSQEVRKVGFTAVKFGYDESSSRVRALLENSGDLYNSGTNKDFTAQITVRFDGAKSWPAFFAKSTGVSGSVATGWSMIQSGNNPGIIYGGSANNTPGKGQLGSGISVQGDWKTITMTVKSENGQRNMRLYVNGETDNAAGQNMGARNLSTPSPMIIGYSQVDGSGDSEFFAVDALYFNKALSQAEIKANLNIKDITKHTAYSNIIGYWPLDDGFGSILENRAPAGLGKDFKLTGPYRWRGANENVPPTRDAVTGGEVSIIASPYDISAIMMYWLKVEIRSDWNLDGNAWLRNFDREIFIQ